MRVAAGLALCFLARGAFAQGGPPLRTDDPGTPGDGNWELNLAFDFERSAGQRVIEAPLVDINYGLGERLQLKYEVPWVHLEDSDDLGDSVAGVKWRFADAEGHRPSVSIYPQVSFGNGETALLLPVEAAWELGEFGLNVEAGHEFRDVGAGGWVAGVAIGRDLGETCELLAEVHGEANTEFDSSAGVINVGTRAHLGPGFSLLASVGCGLWSASRERADLIAYFGLQLRI